MVSGALQSTLLQADEPGKPNVLHSSGKNTAEPGHGIDREVLLRNARDEDGLGLGKGRMLPGDEEVLAEDDKSRELALDEVKDIDCEGNPSTRLGKKRAKQGNAYM